MKHVFRRAKLPTPVADITRNVPMEGIFELTYPNVGSQISVKQLALRSSVLRDLIELRNINSSAMRSEVALHAFSVEIKRSSYLPGSKGRVQRPGWAPARRLRSPQRVYRSAVF